MNAHKPREPQGSLTEVAIAVDGLVVVTKLSMKRALVMIIGCAVLLAISTIAIVFTYIRVHSQTARLEELTARLETLAEEQTKTRAAAEKTQEKVDERATADDEKPTLEIKTSPPKAGKPQAVVVIKPPKTPRPKSPEQPAPAAIEIPVDLPKGTQVSKPPDGGVEKQ